MNPAEAVQAHRDLGARQSTFSLIDEARDLAQARTTAGLAEADFGLLAVGQTRWLQAREARQSAP